MTNSTLGQTMIRLLEIYGPMSPVDLVVKAMGIEHSDYLGALPGHDTLDDMVSTGEVVESESKFTQHRQIELPAKEQA